MQRRRRPLRAILAWAGAALGLQATPATALNPHYLFAQVGQSTASISDVSYDEGVSFVDAAFQDGVPGTDPNARALFSSVNSASGVLLTSGVTVAMMVPNRGRAVGRLEERMFFESGGTTPVVVDALLLLSGSGAGDYIELDASLQVGDCLVGSGAIGVGNPPDVSNSVATTRARSAGA
jgi:hypothetical protein